VGEANGCNETKKMFIDENKQVLGVHKWIKYHWVIPLGIISRNGKLLKLAK
jgi:hypothetical protein